MKTDVGSSATRVETPEPSPFLLGVRNPERTRVKL